MDRKEINVILDNSSDEVCALKFNFCDKLLTVNLYEDDMEQLQKLFIKIMEELLTKDIVFKFDKEKNKSAVNKLALDMCSDYISQLNTDVLALLESENLITLRKEHSK